MVGLRVFDIGALIVWLVWFFRLRDDDDDDATTAAAAAATRPSPTARGPGGLRLPLPDSQPWPTRRRDHLGDLHPPRVRPPRHPPAGAGPRADQDGADRRRDVQIQGGRLRTGRSANPVHMSTSCSVLAERLGEDLAATAPEARRFLLLEQPGPWTRPQGGHALRISTPASRARSWRRPTRRA